MTPERYAELLRANGVKTLTRQIRAMRRRFPDLETDQIIAAIHHIEEAGLWSTAVITFPFGQY